MKKIFPVIVVCALLVAGVASGGYFYIKGSKIDNNAKNTSRNGSEDFGLGRNTESGSLSRSNDGMVAGEISAVESDNITLKLSNEGSKIVFYSNETKISVYENIAEADLAIGNKVTVVGNTGDDGTITAISVQIGSSPAMEGMTNRQGGPDAAEAGDAKNKNSNNAAKMKLLSGEITLVGNGAITVKDSGGIETSFTASDKTKYSKISDGSGADLVSGKIVMITGLTNTDGSITAKSIQIRPELPEIPRQDRIKNAIPKNTPSDNEGEGSNRLMRRGGGMMLPGI
jgi:hypothetical protein